MSIIISLVSFVRASVIVDFDMAVVAQFVRRIIAAGRVRFVGREVHNGEVVLEGIAVPAPLAILRATSHAGLFRYTPAGYALSFGMGRPVTFADLKEIAEAIGASVSPDGRSLIPAQLLRAKEEARDTRKANNAALRAAIAAAEADADQAATIVPQEPVKFGAFRLAQEAAKLNA